MLKFVELNRLNWPLQKGAHSLTIFINASKAHCYTYQNHINSEVCIFLTTSLMLPRNVLAEIQECEILSSSPLLSFFWQLLICQIDIKSRKGRVKRLNPAFQNLYVHICSYFISKLTKLACLKIAVLESYEKKKKKKGTYKNIHAIIFHSH